MSVEQPVTFTVDEIAALIEESLRLAEDNGQQEIVDAIRRNLIQEHAPLWRRLLRWFHLIGPETASTGAR